MSFLRSALIALLCTAATLSSLTSAFAQRNAPESLKRVALVIGNGAYPSLPLKNPVNDARAISRTLKDLGFDVTHRENLTQKAMADAIRQFGARLTPGTAAVFYYAGHGMQVQGRNFLIPVDADVQAEDEVPYSTIDVGLLLGKMEQAKSPANIVILDACRDNPFARRFRPTNTGLAQMDAPIGTLLAYATAPGSVARDGGGENGVFTKHLVANLNTEGLSVEQLFKRVRVAVAQETREMQVPWESSSLKGEFVFKEAPRGRAAASQDQLIEEAVRAAAERAATMTAERIAREQASRPQESQASRQESERLATERESLRQERQRLESDRATLRTETARADASRKTPSATKKTPPAATARISPPTVPAAAPPQRTGGPNPEVGDSWTYRFSDGYGKDGTFTVRITGASAEEITDEARMGNNRHADSFSPGLALSGRNFAGLTVREISPYLQSLGPLEPNAEWRNVAILTGEAPFTARFVGTETVTVPAGTFETRKLVIEGTQVLRAAYGNPSRTFTVTVWYAPAAKRYVKLTFFAPHAAFPAEQDSIELVETNFAMNFAATPKPVAAAKPADSQRTTFFGRPAVTSGTSSLDKAELPRAGDNWTYRFSDGYAKSDTFTVRITGTSAVEITDEARMGNNRHAGSFSPGLALSGRSFAGTSVREISPYLQSLGPLQPTPDWQNVTILSNESSFTARLAGTETVTVPAGTFEAQKLIIEGTQVMRAAYGSPSRSYTITVWYAPAVKRFVKLTVFAPTAAFPGEQDMIELMEFKLN